jgi:hypothetical protein
MLKLSFSGSELYISSVFYDTHANNTNIYRRYKNQNKTWINQLSINGSKKNVIQKIKKINCFLIEVSATKSAKRQELDPLLRIHI